MKVNGRKRKRKTDMEDRFVTFLEEKIELCRRIGNDEAEEHYRYVLTAYKLQLKKEEEQEFLPMI